MVKKNVRDNVVYVSNGYDTRLQYGRIIPVEEMSWITKPPFSENDSLPFRMRIAFKTRHTPDFTEGTFVADSKDIRVESDSDVQGIAPGQFVIIYSEDRQLCLGSGMITSSESRKRHRHRRTGKDKAVCHND